MSSSFLTASIDIDDLNTLNDSAFWERVVAHFRERQAAGGMASSTSTATPLKHAFDARVAGVKSPKSDINALILDYLTMEGYPKAAAKFSKEANLQPQQDDISIRSRQEIQSYIHMGQIEEAIDALNSLDPEILDRNQTLHFSLLRLQLVELIRESNAHGGDIQPALKFARDELAPRAPGDQSFLDNLEQTMALLFFTPDTVPAPLKALLEPGLRRSVADDVNRTILFTQSRRRKSAIRHLVQMRAWAEKTARNKKDLPDRIELGLSGDDNDMMEDRAHENGHEPMVTT